MSSHTHTHDTAHDHEHTHDHDHAHDDHTHDHDHSHDDGHTHDGEHTHDHHHDHGDGHSHGHHHHHHGDGGHHHHGGGFIGVIGAALHLPGFGHDHDHGYTTLTADRALYDNNLGIRTVWLALLALGITTVLQIVIYLASGSVALLADTVHNLGDALNSVPLLAALYLARLPASRRYNYGYGRAEDIAGVLIVISIGFSAGYILYESIDRLINPEPLQNLGWIAAAALIGFVGNELVAMMQINVGQRIGSDAMIADGQHARIDGLTSLAVLIAVFGTWIGVPILDPIVGIVIALAIMGITWNAIKAVWFRVMDAVDPAILDAIEHSAGHVDGVESVEWVRVHWVGHRLYTEMGVKVDEALSLREAQAIVGKLRKEVDAHLPQLGEVVIETVAGNGVNHSSG